MTDLYATGKLCTINNGRDLMMDSVAKKFIGSKCVIVKRCKSGLIQVARVDNSKDTCVVPQYNITLAERD